MALVSEISFCPAKSIGRRVITKISLKMMSRRAINSKMMGNGKKVVPRGWVRSPFEAPFQDCFQ